MILKSIGIGVITMLVPSMVYASFIETTIGTAIINDATASYFNPASLVQLKNPQIITQLTSAHFKTQFTGQTTFVPVGVTETGSARTTSQFLSPSVYYGMPATDLLTIGFAIVSNSANRSIDENSILRYTQARDNIKDFDAIPALAIKINDFFSIGGGINFSYVSMDLQPILGFPDINITDNQSRNKSKGTSIGANAGFLLKLSSSTLVGFNYRSITTYRLSGISEYQGNPRIVSNDYNLKVWAPARGVLSINHFVTPSLGFIGTFARIQWSTLTKVDIHNMVSVIGTTPVILNVSVPYYFRNSWIATLGTIYHINPEWTIRVASTYHQSPGNPKYQIENGDGIVSGLSMGYKLNKRITIDGSYAHAFIQNQNINITNNRFIIKGVNKGLRDAISVRLSFNL